MHSMAAKRGFTHFGWQLFVALMTADINKSDLPENRPQAKQYSHCPKCNARQEAIRTKEPVKRTCLQCGHIYWSRI